MTLLVSLRVYARSFERLRFSQGLSPSCAEKIIVGGADNMLGANMPTANPTALRPPQRSPARNPPQSRHPPGRRALDGAHLTVIWDGKSVKHDVLHAGCGRRLI